jgi:hypothetical protein
VRSLISPAISAVTLRPDLLLQPRTKPKKPREGRFWDRE